MTIRNVQHFSDIDSFMEGKDMYEIYDEAVIDVDGVGEDRILINGPLFRLRGTDLLIAEGTYCAYDEDTGEIAPDFAVSLLYSSRYGLNSPLYWEQGTPAMMFHNYAVMQQGLGTEEADLLEISVA